ncbi:MAG: Bax inhibitor-1 family protein [Patescibacteria group bacterium]|mgnify:FL=1
MLFSIPRPASAPLALSPAATLQTYLLFGLALGLTAVGVACGSLYSATLFRGGLHFVLLLAELGIVFTARWWVRERPWNVILFCLFPLLSGITVTPYLWYVSGSFVNGNAILLNALIASALLFAAAAVFARTTRISLAGMSGFLVLSLIGLIVFGLLQLFVPALRQSVGFEMGLSAAGVVLFAMFAAFDIQRVEAGARAGESPFLLALSLYLDIFNLFLYVLRFITAIAGDRK